MSDQESTSDLDLSISDQESTSDLDQESTSDLDQPTADQEPTPDLSLPNLWDSKSWTYTDSIPRLLVPYHSVKGRGEYLVTVTLIAKADSFEPFSYSVNVESEDVDQPISSRATRIDMADMGCFQVELFEEDAHKQLTFASVTVTRCNKKKYKDPIIRNLHVKVNNWYFDAKELCECEKKRRHKEVWDVWNNSPMAPYADCSPIWCRDEPPIMPHHDVPASALLEFNNWMRYQPLNKWVSVSIYYSPDKLNKFATEAAEMKLNKWIKKQCNYFDD